jgi:hypothetical protein
MSEDEKLGQAIERIVLVAVAFVFGYLLGILPA